MYPCVECNRKKLLQNMETVARMLHADHKIMCAVIKGFCADDDVMEILEDSSCDWLASSRIEDLAKLKTKKTRLFTLIDSDALKEKIIVKMDSSQFELNQDAVIEMIQAGFKMAIEINANFEFNKSNLKLLEIFEYIIVSHEDASKIEYKNKVIIRR